MLDKSMSELVSALSKIIIFIQKNGLANEENSKNFASLKDSYYELLNREIDVLSYNFKTIKKDANKIVHPDKTDLQYVQEAGKLISELNGILDTIEKQRKEMEGQTTYFWSHKTTEEKYSVGEDSKEDDFTEYYKETLSEGLKNLWNLLVHKIPRDYNDYINIKEKYERIITKLKSKISNKDAVIDNLEYRLTTIQREWQKEINQKNVEKIYYEELLAMQKKLNDYKAEMRKYSESIEKIKADLRQSSSQEFETRKNQIVDRLRRNTDLYYQLCMMDVGTLKQKMPGSKNTYGEVKKMIEADFKEFPDIEAVEDHALEQLCRSDLKYSTNIKKLELVQMQCQELEQKIDYNTKNKPIVMQAIVDGINASYQQKYQSVNRKRRLIVNKNRKLKSKLEKMEEANKAFLMKYQNYYEPNYAQEGKRR